MEFARYPLAHLPTPLEEMEGLSAALDGPTIYIKRDDCTGLGFGGNKTRKLEFLIGAALEADEDTVITFGALQSNHVRQTAAACARAGLDCHAILVKQVPNESSPYQQSGNVMLDDVFGAQLHIVDDDDGAAQKLGALLERFGNEGRKVAIHPPGGSTAIGSLGYVYAGQELAHDFDALGISPAAIFHATSTGGTQAGLIVGLALAGRDVPVISFDVYKGDLEKQAGIVRTLVGEVAGLFPNLSPISDDAVIIKGDVIGPGYGIVTDEVREAIDMCARLDGLLLDPVYSGKAMAGLIAAVRAGRFSADQDVVFLHTGGAPGLFAYQDSL